MKHLIATLGFCLLFSAVHAQKYMDELADKTCECFNNLPAETTQEEYQFKFGICLIEHAVDYKKELKKDFQIDLDKLDTETGEKLGELVGIRIALRCPKVLEKLVSTGALKPEDTALTDAPEAVHIFGLTGTITKIEKDFFVVFSIKNEKNVTTKFYWIEPVASNLDLPNEYNSILDKRVIIEYKETQFFDPKIGEYRKINVITSLNQQY